MILEQHYLSCLSQASYLLGDEATRTAVVVDPRRDVDVYVERAAELGLSIRHVFLTHFHADFVSGHLELAARTGAEIHLGAAARADYPFTPARDGERLELGRLRIEVLATPGHTPESISLVVYDLARSSTEPHAVLTGDALFVGDVGRPDLLVSSGLTAAELSGMLYDSLHQKLLKLPGSTLVYPAHGAGSMCGKNLGSETFSTIAAQLATNCALKARSRQEFVAELSAGQPSPPGYFAWDAELNRRQRPTLEQAIERALAPLSLQAALFERDRGAVLLDVREPDDYARRHLRGSVNVGLGGRFASWCGTVLRPDQPLVLVAEPGREREAAVRLARVGFDRVAGYLEGGPAAFAAAPAELAGHPRISAAELRSQLAGPSPPRVVDVRLPAEWEAGHIPGSLNVPLQGLDAGLERLSLDEPLVIQCQSGYRSSIAASLLERHGFSRLQDLQGGWVAWAKAASGPRP
jgi:glyoxylase-like metal-dependent hydrolase (beta-lactamase superfamily II)/rhodanese-related sulfurtransferase